MYTIYSLTDEIPAGDNYSLFKYMDFPKFMSLISMGKLHFTRIDKFDECFKENEPGKVLKALQKTTGGGYHLPDFVEESKKCCISCWTQTSIESYPLWEAYGRSAYSLAIQSDVSHIQNSILHHTPSAPIQTITMNTRCGKVNYFDKFVEAPPENCQFFFYKPCQFEDEKEYRFLINGDRLSVCNTVSSYFENSTVLLPSIDIPINPKELIKHIYVSYHASEWFYELIKSIVIKYELVNESNIDDLLTWSVLK